MIAPRENPAVNEISVLGQKVRLLQLQNGFRTSMDSVLVAAACPAKGRENLLDLGCGVGSAGLCVLYREPQLRLTGYDISEAAIDLAYQNAALNKCEGQVQFAQQNILTLTSEGTRFDHIICNPPFYESGAHLRSPETDVAVARGFEGSKLEDWINAAFRILASRGSLTIIFPPAQLPAALNALGRRFGGTEVFQIQSKAHEPVKRVIVRSFKDRKGPLVMHRAVIMHDENGGESDESRKLLREGLSFDTLVK